jgi:uncharacterized protein (TIGR02271 family)
VVADSGEAHEGPASAVDQRAAGPKEAEEVLQLFAEEVSVGKEAVETGRLRVSKQTHTRQADVDADLLREEAIVETVPCGRRIFAVPVTRVEGDTTMIPVVEKVLHTEKRLFLKEEIGITRRRATDHFHDTVALRRQEAVVSRLQSATEQPSAEPAQHIKRIEERDMAYETLVAVYDTPQHADAAVKALKTAGFHESDISVFTNQRLMTGKKTLAEGVKQPGFWQRLFGDDVYEHEAKLYGQSIEDGGVVVSVRVPESEVAHASAVLDIHRPVDVHDRAVTLGLAPAAKVETIENKIAEVPLAAVQTVAVTPKLAAAMPEVLRLAEEQLNVGKEMVETGRTRVRRFVTEKEVAANVTLHDEHAEVVRKAISDPNTSATSTGRTRTSRSSRLPSTRSSTRPPALSRKWA